MNKTLTYYKPKKVQLVTLGCSKNRVDSEHLLRQIDKSAIEIVGEDSNLQNGDVDTVILNTCGFIKDAKEESVEAIFQAVYAKQNNLIKRIFVFGCLSERYKDELVAEIPEVDGFYGAFNTDDVMEAIGIKRNESENLNRFLTTPKHYAYLKISEGCDRTCSYCSIPLIRGKHISVPMEDLVQEAKNLAKDGVKELIVIAQDTTYYGLDLYKERKLAELLRKLSGVEGIEWIRLHYSYPAQFPLDVIEEMTNNPKICKYLDIPLQHASSKVLKNMRRGVDQKGTQNLIDALRDKMPNVYLRTTMIVGHPGEDKKEFEKLLAFVEKNKFQRLGAFTYSEEEGTYGAENLPDTIRESTKQKRYDQLMELQSEISYEINNSRINSIERVIVDSFTDGVLVGRSMYESPEVDGEILITPPSNNPESYIGKFIDVKIIGANEYDLLAEIIN